MSGFSLKNPSGSPVSKDELLEDLLRVAKIVGTTELTKSSYRTHGRFGTSSYGKHFGSWNRAIEAAGLMPAHEVLISNERLFENLMHVWEKYGRQPTRSELKIPPSKFTHNPYVRSFNSWRRALEAFVDFANSKERAAPVTIEIFEQSSTPRSPTLRTRFKILSRDNFKCVACGASPATTHGLRLHVDHIVAWSKGGLTEEANLQTLCEPCNLGKSNVL